MSVADDGGSTTSASGTATVADAAITASCATAAVSLQSFNGTVASLSDANTGAPASDFTATINWGDASTSAGTVTGSGGSYSITGSHSYSSTGYYNVTTAVTDDGGSTSTTGPCQVLVFAFAPGGGAFVIGNGNSAIGTAVTFWGAQWWKLNTLSGGAELPPHRLEHRSGQQRPATGRTTSGLPGCARVEQDLHVRLADLGQHGPHRRGPDKHRHAPNPGHAGTGTVVAQVC